MARLPGSARISFLLRCRKMSVKTINGKFYWYVEETGEYLDPVTREPVKMDENKPEEPDRKQPQKRGPIREQ